MNNRITIDILNSKAVKLLKNLAELNLILIKSEKQGFAEVLDNLRTKAANAPSLEEIAKEVELARAERYGSR